MFYGIEKAAEAHRHELLRDAQQERLVRLAVGQRSFNVRQPVGRFFVRLGSRLNREPQREAQLAEPVGNLG